MNAPIHRTDRGTIETTWHVITALVGTFTLLGILVTAGAWVSTRAAQIAGAVQRPEFQDTVAAVRRDLNAPIDSLRTRIAQHDTALLQLNHQILGLLCEQNHNPKPWCAHP